MENLPGWLRRRSGIVVPGGSWREWRQSARSTPSGIATRHEARTVSAEREPRPNVRGSLGFILISWRRDADARERLALVQRGQALGLGALFLTLATVVTLTALGQPWVAGIVATGMPVIVAIFVTGKYQPAPAHIREAEQRQLDGHPQQEVPGVAPTLPSSAIE